jgi:hypothetical protein
MILPVDPRKHARSAALPAYKGQLGLSLSRASETGYCSIIQWKPDNLLTVGPEFQCSHRGMRHPKCSIGQ